MFIVTASNLSNPGALETRSLPKKFLGRVAVIPRRGAGWSVVARIVFEVQILRYFTALAPFVVAMFVWRELALPLAQAPLAMILVIALIETKLLHYSPEAREKLISESGGLAVLDKLSFRGRGILPTIAARHGLTQGRVHLVVEQSEIARVKPLTLVSVQADGPNRVLDLSDADQTELAGLFDADLTESALAKVNARDKQYVRDIAYDVRGVSAQARMAARLAARDSAA